jgi:hypothetical protein
MSDDNVTPIGRSKPPILRETQPDWLEQANQLGRDVAGADEATDTLDADLRASLEAQGVKPDEPREHLHIGQDYTFHGDKSDYTIPATNHGANRIIMGGSPTSPAHPFRPIFRNPPVLESVEPEPMRADKPWVRRTILAGLVFIGLAAFAISFGAIYDVAGWTGWQPWQQLLTPLLFDAGIVVFTFLSFIRLEREQAAWSTFLLAEALTVASSVIQVIHTLDTSPMPAGSVELWVACVIAAMPPLILSATSYLTGRTIFRRAGQPGGSPS